MSLSLAERFLSTNGRARAGSVVAELRSRYGERLSTVQSVREQHGKGEAFDAGSPPDAVVWPESTDEVSAIVTLCAGHDVPLIPFGAGTSLEGHVSAPYGGICLDLSRMNQVLAVHDMDADCVVQPGITRKQLNAYLRDTGLHFPVDPGADASVGGMLSTRASGTTTVRYGAMSQQVLALQAVLADGRVVRCGTRARKSAAGYDLVRLFVGAEGTLGVVTEITLRLHPRPDAAGTLRCSFASMRDAVDTVVALSQSGTSITRIEFLDEVQVRACNAYASERLPEQPLLLIEFQGQATAVAEQLQLARALVGQFDGQVVGEAENDAERDRLWKVRHNAYFAALALRPGCRAVVADVCVPLSELTESVIAARSAIDSARLLAPMVGHVGDGNFHVVFLVDPSSPQEFERASAVYDALIDRALSVGGTCTGEHGIGFGKREKLVKEAGPEVVGLMQAVKRAWDPNGILNPGKIFLDEP
ncbi:MAG: FAD-linked oxidase C-terminal domain-containing protein [Steroidobacteraceae bacterium]